MQFIDLFAGLGGFHLALRDLGHECVFASEIDTELRELYEKNFGLKPEGDLRKVSIGEIPAHDILCAGFPCQPFSKAGEQEGFDCPTWGDLFSRIVKILRRHKPKFLLLENVPNLLKHDKGETWKHVQEELSACGYAALGERFSPHEFGVPQIRERLYIVGKRKSLEGFNWPARNIPADLSIRSILDEKPKDGRPLSVEAIKCLDMWQDFISTFPKDKHLPTFPIWAMEFGANYPYEDLSPYTQGRAALKAYKGAYGVRISESDAHSFLDYLPPYSRVKQKRFPDWKIDFIRKNRSLYSKHKGWIDDWRSKLLDFPPSLQKLEWNHKGGKREIYEYVIQFRASGVRVKKPSTAPSLIAMTVTQVPVIGWERRYLTSRECARLQTMDELKHLPKAASNAFKALGNAINVKVMQAVAKQLLVSSAAAKVTAELAHKGRSTNEQVKLAA